MGSLANAFALLGVELDHEASTIVAEVKKEVEEHKKIVAENKKIAAQKKKVQQKKLAAQKKKAEAENKKITPGNGQRYVHNGLQRNGQPLSEDQWLAGEAQRNQQWLANREQWLANQERWLARDAERKRDMALKTLKEYEEQKALEKQRKALEKQTSMSAPETPPKEATPDNFITKHKSKNAPARGLRGTQDSRKNLNNVSWARYSKRNQDNALPDENNNTVEVKAEAAPAPDLTETNFPVLGRVTKPTKLSVKHSRKDNAN